MQYMLLNDARYNVMVMLQALMFIYCILLSLINHYWRQVFNKVNLKYATQKGKIKIIVVIKKCQNGNKTKDKI